jgi:hypothetical protein
MTNLINRQSKTEVWRNRKRTALVVGITAVAGAASAGILQELGMPSLDWGPNWNLRAHKPDLSWLPGIDKPHVEKPEGSGSGSSDNTPDAGESGTGQGGTGSGGTGSVEGAGPDADHPGYIDKPHDGIKADGNDRIPKHGKLGQSFDLEHGSGQIREIQQYAAAHNYQGIDAEKATQVWDNLKDNPLTDGNHKLINISGNHDTYNVGSDVRMSRPDLHAEWGSRLMERALREELEKEAEAA